MKLWKLTIKHEDIATFFLHCVTGTILGLALFNLFFAPLPYWQ